MNTNIKIVTTDEERAAIAKNSGNPLKMVSRKDINILVEDFIRGLIEGKKVEQGPITKVDGLAEIEPKASGNRSLSGFVPSRGDEDYLYTGSDDDVTDACRTILDQLDRIDKFVWDRLERNRV